MLDCFIHQSIKLAEMSVKSEAYGGYERISNATVLKSSQSCDG